MPAISPLIQRDVAAVSELAGVIWRKHYPGIISPEQIEYMLAQRYHPALIGAQLASAGIWWNKLVLDEKIIGFSCCMLTNTTGELKLDKLYIHPDHQRKGYGAMLIEETMKTARENHCTRLTLAVNKNNHAAIAAYRRYGFKICGAVVTDIGNCFVMDDYFMALTVAARETD